MKHFKKFVAGVSVALFVLCIGVTLSVMYACTSSVGGARASSRATGVQAPAMGGPGAEHASALAQLREGYRARPATRDDVWAALGGGGHAAALPRGAVPTETRRDVAMQELWVIQKAQPAASRTDDVPGCGAVVTRLPGSDEVVPVPLERTDVSASVAGFLQAVEVKQRFHNPFSSKIEAVYVFPLPEQAAVSEFVMIIGDRQIRGVVREREEAEKIYHEARAAGYVASLLTQERPNIFTQKVANIEPGRSIDVTITYYGTLAYHDGALEFVFPMVVGPRFNPPGTADPVHATPRGTPPTGGTQVSYLRPGQRSGHDIGVSVAVEAGVAIESIESVNHAVEKRIEGSKAVVRLSAADSVPNKDFVLRVRIAGDAARSALLTADDGAGGGHFLLMVVPPRSVQGVQRSPVEMVFVVDGSGSMNGAPIGQAKDAVKRGLRALQPQDSFQIINFAENASVLGPTPLPATRENIGRGMRHVDSIASGGGTYMLTGLRAALDFPHDPSRLRVVAFMTDGFIGNENEILREQRARLRGARVFSFGVGSSTNRALMDSMARMGRGAVAYLAPGDSASRVMDLFMERISRPALMDMSFQLEGASAGECFPSVPPDVFVGRPVMIAGRYEGTAPRSARIRGRTGGEQVEILAAASELSEAAQPLARRALPKVWARMKLAEIGERAVWDTENTAILAEDAKRTALSHALLSPFTAFLAVDSSRRTEGDHGTTIAVPVPVPEGVRYETTVGKEGGR